MWHHRMVPAGKGAPFLNILAARRPGGIFVEADTSVPVAAALRERAFRCWAEAMQARGSSDADARRHFANWADEDFYGPLFTEFRLLAEAGFSEPECFWREGAAAVFGASKEG